MISLFLSQVVSVQIVELHNLYSQAWDNYAFMTHVVRHPVFHDTLIGGHCRLRLAAFLLGYPRVTDAILLWPK